MKQIVNTSWLGNMKFGSELDGHRIVTDLSPEGGGEDAGPRPKQLMLVALAGCTGLDVISILKKMRVEFDYFNMLMEADVTEDHPKHYTSIHLIYQFKGKNLDVDKLKKAADLSQEKYCGVAAVYKKALKLTYEIQLLE